MAMKCVPVRMTDEERETVKSDAREARMSLNQYMRMRLRLKDVDRRFKEGK